MSRHERFGVRDRLLALVISLGGLSFTPHSSIASDLPDFVLVDIFLGRSSGSPDSSYLGATIRNDGANFRGQVSVTCDFACRGYSRRYVGGLTLENGLDNGREVNLSNRNPLNLESCFFVSRRSFTCHIDKNDSIIELNEDNNSLSKELLTGR